MTGRIVRGMPDAGYRAAAGVNQSSLKTILDCPARYRWEQDTQRPGKDAYDFGHVVHAMVLGRGVEYARLDFPDRRTKAFKEADAEAREAGLVPLVSATYDRAAAAAAAVRSHPLAGPILTREGEAEVAAFWQRPDGRECKALIDWLTVTPDDTHWLIDVKTKSGSVAPSAFAKSVADYGYHVQQAWYQDGYYAATGVFPRFLFVVVGTDAPHHVMVGELADAAVDKGRELYEHALTVLGACEASGRWPGYTDTEPATIELPAWATR